MENAQAGGANGDAARTQETTLHCGYLPVNPPPVVVAQYYRR
jgi:hypothetical protein